MDNATFTTSALTTSCRLDDLALAVTDQHLRPDRAVLACRPVEPGDWCQRCGCHGSPRDSVVRELAHVPFGWRPTTLQVWLRRYQCRGCGHVWRQDLTRACAPRSWLSRGALPAALGALAVNHLSMTRIAAALDVAWNPANDAALVEGQRLLIDHQGSSNGPIEAINGRLEDLCGTVPAFRSLTHYIARSLLEAGGLRPDLHPHL